MWKSKVQYKWEKAARKIGIKVKVDKNNNVFTDYWELPLDTKVQDLEEIVPPFYKIKFYK